MKREGYDSIADLFRNDYIENIKNSDYLIEKDNEKKEKKENNNEEETKKDSIKDKESNEENKKK